MKKRKKNAGQATIEYLFILVFIAGISVKMVRGFSDFFAKNIGSFAFALSRNLTIGSCKDLCFHAGTDNGVKIGSN